MNRRKRIITSILTLGLLLAPMIGSVRIASAATTIYVDAHATGAGNGSSWADAYTDLQDALSAATSGDEIWVAEGVYKPGSAGDRSATFQLKNGMGVYGGFAGTESSRDQRDWQTHVTVLSGDIDDNDTTNADGVVTDTDDIAGSNSYHVVTGSGTDSTATLDGFTITGGYAESMTSPDSLGGGMFTFNGDPTLTNLIFCGNRANSFGGGMYNTSGDAMLTNVTFRYNFALMGGGMFNSQGNITLTNVTFSDNTASLGGGLDNYDSSPTLTDVIFNGNTASSEGGGMYNDNSSNPVLTNAAFIGNIAGDYGGGMLNDAGSSPWLTNVIFSGNNATLYGGGMVNVDSNSPVLTNVTFNGNTATTGGGMYNVSSSDPQLYNCILWGNSASSSGDQIANVSSTPAIYYSLIQDSGGSGGWDTSLGTDGGGNIDADPQFVDADGADDTPGTADDNLRLEGDSPAVDAGDNGWLTAGTDLDYHARRVDMPQADTGSSTAPIVDMGAYEAHLLYVDADATGGARDGSRWDDAYTDLQDALTAASAEIEIWVAEGVYKPGSAGDRTVTFQLKNGVDVYGGFAGTETALDQRDWEANVTVLSGDIDNNDTTDANGVVTDTANIVGDNSYHVIDGSSTNSSAVLDGFTITAGHADGNGINDRGAGMYISGGSPTLRNLTLSGNHATYLGGGMACLNGNPDLVNVTFIYNVAGSTSNAVEGGGMYNQSSAATLESVAFIGNQANSTTSWADGGGMANNNSNLTLVNVLFVGNTVSASDTSSGGGMSNTNGSDPTLINVTFSGNTAGYGGGIVNGNSSPTLANCILWGNTAGASDDQISNLGSSTPVISYSTIKDAYSGGSWDASLGTDGGGNIDADPRFVDADGADNVNGTLDDDLRLRLNSPAIDAGDNSAVPGNVTTDIAGNPRFFDAPSVPDTGNGSAPVVDMGAYEVEVEVYPIYLPLVLRSFQ